MNFLAALDTLAANTQLLRPHALWLWLALPIIAWGLYAQKAAVTLPQLAPHFANLLIRTTKRSAYARFVLLPLWALLVLALAGPAKRVEGAEGYTHHTPMWVVLDLSLSMMSADVSPDRLSVARFRITDLINAYPDYLISLIVYAGSAHTVVPLTEDGNTIQTQLPNLTPTIMPVLGSEPTTAFNLIEASIASLNAARATPSGHVVWLTDEATSADIAALSAKSTRLGQTLTIVAVGTEQGAPIPLAQGGVLRDARQQPVIAKAPIATMRRASNDAGTALYTADNPSWIGAFQVRDGALRTENTNTTVWQSVAHWLLIPALLLFLPFFQRSALFIIALLAFLPPSFMHASPFAHPDQKAHALYREGNYEDAQRTFERADWQAASAYRAGDYETAARLFSENGAFYNAGNAYAHLGDWQAAINAYKTMLDAEPNHANAKYNLALIEQLLAENAQQNEASSQDGEASEQNNEQRDAQGQDGQQGEPSKNGETGATDQQGGEQNASNTSPTDNTERNNGEHRQADQGNAEGASTATDNTDNTNEPIPSTQNLDADTAYRDSEDRTTATTAEQAAQDDEHSERLADANAENEAPANTTDSAQDGVIASTTLAIDPEVMAEQERAQALQQWLRIVPDTPSVLLKRKFDYQQRQQGGKAQAGGKSW